MAQFKKKAIIIKAIQWTGTTESFKAIQKLNSKGKAITKKGEELHIPVGREGRTVPINTWIVKMHDKDVILTLGHVYPFSPEDFKKNYVAFSEDLFDFSGDMTDEQFHDKNIIANKTLRVNLDEQLQNLKQLPPSRERSLAITKLQESIMWLGMDLKRLNTPNPYPDSYKPENTKIAPTADNLEM